MQSSTDSQSSDTLVVAVVQSSFSDDTADNLARMEGFARAASGQGAQIVVLPELVHGRYFPQHRQEANFQRAMTVQHDSIVRFQRLAAELNVVIPVSFFEKSPEGRYFNTVAMIDAGGALLGTYRKSHIPDGPGYWERFYFREGDTGFRTWATRFGAIGVGICWDQWFPEAARAMVLAGADLLVYPTAIGTEPNEPELDTRQDWQRAMVGHAVCNSVAVAAANRVGREDAVDFYGNSFIASHRGEVIGKMDAASQGVCIASLNLRTIRAHRESMGFFRDRREDLYRRD